MDMTGVIVILLVACLILISICLGLALGVLLMLRRRSAQCDSTTKEVETTPSSSNPSPEARLNEISNKLDKLRQEHLRGKYENLSYILWGFTLAMLSLTIINHHPVNILATIVFFIMGWGIWGYSRIVKAK